MALSAPPTPLVITLTQGSADAFIEGSVLTGLTGRQAYRVAGIAFGFPIATLNALSAVSAFDISLAITRRSKSALPALSDNDVLHRWSVANFLLTSGSFNLEGDYYWVPDFELPLVEETIYAQLDSSGTGLSLVMVVRIDVEIDTISDIDRLNLITRSLT